MPPKRPVENNEESEEKRLRLDESPGFSVEPVTHNTCQGCDRVADEVTCGLQPLPGPSSEEQPSSHKPAQGVANSQDKTKSLVEQMFYVNQSLADFEETQWRILVFKKNCPVQHEEEEECVVEDDNTEQYYDPNVVEVDNTEQYYDPNVVEVDNTEQYYDPIGDVEHSASPAKSSEDVDEDFLDEWNSESELSFQSTEDVDEDFVDEWNSESLSTEETCGIPRQPLPSSSILLQLGKSVERPRPYYDEVDFCEVDCNSERGFPPSGIPVDVYQYLVADDWSSIKVEGPEHTVIEIEGFPDYPFDSGTFQVAFKAKRIAPCRFLTGTKFVFKQPKSDRYGVSKENAITHLTAEESLKELERQNETKTAKEVQVAAVCRSLCDHFSQECKTKIKDFGRDISVIPSVHVKLKSGQFPPWGSIEPYIQGRWAKFINNDGQVVDIGERPRKPVQEFSQKCLAFSHWTYKQFQGKAVVCDLQGADFQLTDLEIASSDGRLFGMGNLGDDALDVFKRNHICNEYCAALKLGGNHSPET